jgi:hypothetical protein
MPVTLSNTMALLGIIAAAVLFYALASLPAYPRDLGQWEAASPDERAYYSSLMQPDNPIASCCGEGDAYYADEVDECRLSDGADCALVAIITDERDDAPRGRPHIDIGTRFAVPHSKIRKRASENPTGHNILFVHATYGWVHCWEPLPGI